MKRYKVLGIDPAKIRSLIRVEPRLIVYGLFIALFGGIIGGMLGGRALISDAFLSGLFGAIVGGGFAIAAQLVSIYDQKAQRDKERLEYNKALVANIRIQFNLALSASLGINENIERDVFKNTGAINHVYRFITELLTYPQSIVLSNEDIIYLGSNGGLDLANTTIRCQMRYNDMINKFRVFGDTRRILLDKIPRTINENGEFHPSVIENAQKIEYCDLLIKSIREDMPKLSEDIGQTLIQLRKFSNDSVGDGITEEEFRIKVMSRIEASQEKIKDMKARKKILNRSVSKPTSSE